MLFVNIMKVKHIFSSTSKYNNNKMYKHLKKNKFFGFIKKTGVRKISSFLYLNFILEIKLKF